MWILCAASASDDRKSKTDPDILALRLPTLDAGRADDVPRAAAGCREAANSESSFGLRDCGAVRFRKDWRLRACLCQWKPGDAEGQTVSTQTFAADPSKVMWKGPVSILIDGTTSGAAEVLAAAIAGTHRGDVVGERTFGLASEQKLITIDDGSALILTVANYYNANGKSILEEGVTPTEVVRPELVAADDSSDDEDSTTGQTTVPAGQSRSLRKIRSLRKALGAEGAGEKGCVVSQ